MSNSRIPGPDEASFPRGRTRREPVGKGSPGRICLSVEKAIRSRRTVRRLDGSRIGRAVVERLLEMASLAPSPHNIQPWRFAVVLDEAGKQRLAQAMGEAWRRDLERDGLPAEAIAARVEESHRRLTSAAIVVVCVDRSDLDAYPDEARRAAETTMAVQSLGAAIQNFLLAAHALGLGAGWMCAPLFCQETVVSCLGLDECWEPQALVLLGDPGEIPPPPRRRPLAEIARFLGESP